MAKLLYLLPLVAILILSGCTPKVETQLGENSEPDVLSYSDVVVDVFVNVSINEDQVAYTHDFKEGETALELLKRLDEKSENFSFLTENFEGIGEFITTINNIKADSTKEFWNFKINGEDSSVGISDYIVQQGDVLHFKLEKF